MSKLLALVLLAAGTALAQDKRLMERPAEPPKARRPIPIVILDDGVLYAESPFAGQTAEERQRAFRVLVEAVKTALRELDEEGFFSKEKKCAVEAPPRK
jgi:riboflavin biosynthesis pyrimidine reductase